MTEKVDKYAILKAQIASYILSGDTYNQAAQKAGISPFTIAKWKQRDPKFRQMLGAPPPTGPDDTHQITSAQAAKMEITPSHSIPIQRAMLYAVVGDAIRTLHETILDKTIDPKIRLTAACEVLDRTGHVKSKDIHVSHNIPQNEPTDLRAALTALGVEAKYLERALPVEGTVINDGEATAGRVVSTGGEPPESGQDVQSGEAS